MRAHTLPRSKVILCNGTRAYKMRAHTLPRSKVILCNGTRAYKMRAHTLCSGTICYESTYFTVHPLPRTAIVGSLF